MDVCRAASPEAGAAGASPRKDEAGVIGRDILCEFKRGNQVNAVLGRNEAGPKGTRQRGRARGRRQCVRGGDNACGAPRVPRARPVTHLALRATTRRALGGGEPRWSFRLGVSLLSDCGRSRLEKSREPARRQRVCDSLGVSAPPNVTKWIAGLSPPNKHGGECAGLKPGARRSTARQHAAAALQTGRPRPSNPRSFGVSETIILAKSIVCTRTKSKEGEIAEFLCVRECLVCIIRRPGVQNPLRTVLA